MNTLSLLFLLLTSTSSFLTPSFFPKPTSSPTSSHVLKAEGFASKPPPREKSEAQINRELETGKFDELASTGGQEYQIYVRLFGQDAESWLPCGQIAVPRGEQVSRAIYSNEENVKKGTLRTWAGLRGKESEMEFGYNLKIYPDDVIEVAKKEVEVKGFGGVGKWFSDLLSPVDTSDVKK